MKLWSSSLCVFALLATSVQAEDPYEHIVSTQGFSWPARFGGSLASIGDVDGDSVGDYAVGAWDGFQTSTRGYVHLYSGRSRRLLHTFSGAQVADNLGIQVRAVNDDLNSDGAPDFLAGAHGYVKVYSGGDYATIRTTTQPTATTCPTCFGEQLASGGDINNDGHNDYAIGDPSAGSLTSINGTNYRNGRVYLFSGSTGTLLRTIEGNSASGNNIGAQIGGTAASNRGALASTLAITDVTGDSYDDIVILSAQSDSNVASRFSVFSGSSGAYLYGHSIADYSFPSGSKFTSVSALGDMNDDGTPDFAVGVKSSSSTDAGAVLLISGGNGSTIGNPLTGDIQSDEFGFSSASLDDIDGDATPDFTVGAPNINGKGYVRVFSGADRSVIHTVTALESGTGLGSVVVNAGDLNGDSHFEFMAGAPLAGSSCQGALCSTSGRLSLYGASTCDFVSIPLSPRAVSVCL